MSRNDPVALVSKIKFSWEHRVEPGEQLQTGKIAKKGVLDKINLTVLSVWTLADCKWCAAAAGPRAPQL